MADIARLAGVSVASVSRALSGSGEVGEKTRQRILELARSLNYAVHAGASNLRRGKSRTISVIAPFLSGDSQRLTDPFLWGLVGSIAEALADRGSRMLLSRVPEAQLSFSDDVETGLAAGVILTGQWLPHEKLNELAVAGIPFAIWGAERPKQLYCTVGSDNQTGGRLATEHLIARGARQIAFVGDVGAEEVRLRHVGYLEAHRRHGLEPDPVLFENEMFELHEIRLWVQRLLAQGVRFDGVFAASDMAAIAVMRALMEFGMRVPEDVAVVGYDDVPAAALVTPSLTTIRQPMETAGRALVDAVLSQVEGTPAATKTVPIELVIRDSSARRPRAHTAPPVQGGARKRAAKSS